MTAALDVEVGGDVSKGEILVTAERSVLGAAMRSPAAYERAAALITGASFADPRHERIWDAIGVILAQGTPAEPVKADPALVAAYLLEQGTLGTVGGAGYLGRLVGETATTENATWYAKIVAGGARDRAMVELGLRLQQGGASALSADERDALLADTLTGLEDLGTIGHDDPNPMIGESLNGTFDILEGNGRQGITTGLAELDAILGGLTGGQVVIVGARPATGKTVVAQSFATHVAKDLHLPVLSFCLEMGAQEMLARLLSAEAQINSRKLNLAHPDLDETDWNKLVKHVPDVLAMPLYVCAEETMTPARINALVGAFKRKHPDLGLVTIDYAQLLSADVRTSNRQEEVSYISREIKKIAKRHDVPIVLLAQLNRGPEQRADRRPQMSDLRESGAFEQDSDIVILLHREDQFDPETTRAGEMDLIVVKHRNGATGTAVVAAQLHYYRLCNFGVTENGSR